MSACIVGAAFGAASEAAFWSISVTVTKSAGARWRVVKHGYTRTDQKILSALCFVRPVFICWGDALASFPKVQSKVVNMFVLGPWLPNVSFPGLGSHVTRIVMK